MRHTFGAAEQRFLMKERYIIIFCIHDKGNKKACIDTTLSVLPKRILTVDKEGRKEYKSCHKILMIILMYLIYPKLFGTDSGEAPTLN